MVHMGVGRATNATLHRVEGLATLEAEDIKQCFGTKSTFTSQIHWCRYSITSPVKGEVHSIPVGVCQRALFVD